MVATSRHHSNSNVRSHTRVGDGLRDAGHRVEDWGEIAGLTTDRLINKTLIAANRFKLDANVYKNKTLKYVKQNPVKSALIAAGVGIVLGLIFRR